MVMAARALSRWHDTRRFESDLPNSAAQMRGNNFSKISTV
jgi:hypothetical protein